MSVLSELRRMPESRRGAMAPLKQIGVRNGMVTLTKALIRSRMNRAELPRQFMLSFWDTLGNREAIIDGKNRITFSQFKERVLRFANGLHNLGLQPGDRFAELLYNSSTWFEAMGAGTITGIHMPMLNWHLKPNELAQCINASEPKALLVDAEFVDAIVSIKDKIPTVKHFIVVGDTHVDGMISYEQLLAESEPVLPPGKFDMAPRPFSGGTTGTPKFMNINRDRLTADSDTDRRGATKDELVRLGLMQLTAFYHYKLGELKDPVTRNVRSLIPGPLYHAGVQVGVLPFFLGGTVVPMRRFDPEGFLKLVQEERINWVFVAPTMLERILALPEDAKSRYNLSSLRTLICAAAPCPPKVKKEINALFRRQGAPDDVFHEYYAASETGLVTILAPEDYQADEKRYDSVGKVRGCDVRIYDEESESWAPPGKEGRLLMRTPTVFGLEYAGVDEDAMRKNFKEIDGKLWYDDGLIGYLDEQDYLYLTSRVKEMIISGGVNIFPNEIEHVIKHHPKVFDVAVVRAPDKDLGEVAAAVVQLKEGQTATAEEIIEHCKQEGLYGFKIPRIVDFGELPRNLAGKLPKKQLEAHYWEGHATYG
ncbi:MAG: AMP-binding protein [Pseudomonadota bacterium]|nr:AMP-binding protein [Pseudomonadota bacterium]